MVLKLIDTKQFTALTLTQLLIKLQTPASDKTHGTYQTAHTCMQFFTGMQFLERFVGEEADS